MTLAADRRVGTGALTGVLHAYPGYADGTWNAAIDDVTARLGSPLARTVLPVLVRARPALAAYRSATAGRPAGQAEPRSRR